MRRAQAGRLFAALFGLGAIAVGLAAPVAGATTVTEAQFTYIGAVRL
jgi:hypothetical protein